MKKILRVFSLLFICANFHFCHSMEPFILVLNRIEERNENRKHVCCPGLSIAKELNAEESERSANSLFKEIFNYGLCTENLCNACKKDFATIEDEISKPIDQILDEESYNIMLTGLNDLITSDIRCVFPDYESLNSDSDSDSDLEA